LVTAFGDGLTTGFSGPFTIGRSGFLLPTPNITRYHLAHGKSTTFQASSLWKFLWILFGENRRKYFDLDLPKLMPFWLCA
jgi:hypothetical protein